VGAKNSKVYINQGVSKSTDQILWTRMEIGPEKGIVSLVFLKSPFQIHEKWLKALSAPHGKIGKPVGFPEPGAEKSGGATTQELAAGA